MPSAVAGRLAAGTSAAAAVVAAVAADMRNAAGCGMVVETWHHVDCHLQQSVEQAISAQQA